MIISAHLLKNQLGPKTISVEQEYDYGFTKIKLSEKVSTGQYLEDASKKLKSMGYGAYEHINLNQDFPNKTRTYTSQEEINEAMWLLGDHNKDEIINNEEYLNLLNQVVSGEKTTFWGEIFGREYKTEDLEGIKFLQNLDKEIDINKDGLLTKEEFSDSYVNYILTSEG